MNFLIYLGGGFVFVVLGSGILGMFSSCMTISKTAEKTYQISLLMIWAWICIKFLSRI